MDVVHLAGILLQIRINKRLKRPHRQLNLRVRHSEKALVPGIGIGDGVTRALTLMSGGIERLKRRQNLFRVHAKQHAMNWLKFQCVVVIIHHFHQRVSLGQRCPLLLRRDLLSVFVAGFRRGQRVVPVAHGKQQRRGILHAIFLLHLRRGAQALQRVGRGIHLGLGQKPTGEVASALLQVKVIELFHVPVLPSQRLDHCSVRVVDQQHHMGQLNGRVLPDLDPGRDAGENGPLRGADQRTGARRIVILVQINHADQTVAHFSVGLGALHVNQRRGQRFEHAAVHIPLHGPVDVSDMLFHIRVAQLCLGQNQAESRGGVTHVFLHGFPVFRLGGELIAGHHGPFAHVLVFRKQDVRRIETQKVEFLVHMWSPFPIFQIFQAHRRHPVCHLVYYTPLWDSTGEKKFSPSGYDSVFLGAYCSQIPSNTF